MASETSRWFFQLCASLTRSILLVLRMVCWTLLLDNGAAQLAKRLATGLCTVWNSNLIELDDMDGRLCCLRL
jgi:hypothetical protein